MITAHDVMVVLRDAAEKRARQRIKPPSRSGATFYYRWRSTDDGPFVKSEIFHDKPSVDIAYVDHKARITSALLCRSVVDIRAELLRQEPACEFETCAMAGKPCEKMARRRRTA